MNHSALRIRLLGGFVVEWQGEPLPETSWKRPQARTLLKLLATEQSHRLHREQLVELFWPEQSLDMAVGNLRRLLYLARRSLPPDAREAIAQWDDVVMLDSSRVWIDVDAFEQAAHAALIGGLITDAEAALSLYVGELLPEERYADWATGRREALAKLRQEVLLSLARRLTQEGETETAIERLHDLLTLDPTEETAHRELMRLYVASGNRREALRQYARCRDALAEHVGVEPDSLTEALRGDIEAGKLVASVPLLPPAVTRPWSTPMIGRERALELVLGPPISRGADPDPREERVGLVFVRGEAGVGKTRLAAEAAREAGGRGCEVLWGTCAAQAPYGPFIEALEQYADRLTLAERVELERNHPELARILPSLEPAPSMAPIEVAGDELRLFAAVARFLAQLAAVRPVLLVLDDLQNADAATLTLMGYLARLPITRRNWLVLGTYRIEEVQSPGGLAAMLAELRRSGRCRQVDLLRLGRRDCVRLVEGVLEGAVGEEVSEHVFATSLGNPLFAVELVRGLRVEGELIWSEQEWQFTEGTRRPLTVAVTDQITDLIGARIASLDEETTTLLALIAVAGTTAPVTILRFGVESMGGTIDTLLHGLELAVGARVLEEVAGPETGIGTYGFHHPLFREVIYGRLGAARRMHLHEVVAQATEAMQPQDLDVLAYHYARSGNREKSTLYLERAADRARSMYANAQAEQQYRDVLLLLSEVANTELIAQVQLKLGTTLHLLGRYGEALVILESAADRLAAAGDLDGVGRAVADIGRTHVMRSTAGEAVERLERAITDLMGRVNPRVLSDLYDALARCLLALGRYAESEVVSERASEHARQYMNTSEGGWQLARAELQRASAAYFTRPSTEAHRLLLDVLPLIERGGDPELLTHAYNLAAYSALTEGDLPESCRRYEQALEVAERMVDPGRAGRFRCLLGRSLFFIGRGQEGLRIAKEGYAQLVELGPSLYLAFGSHMLGVIYFGMGCWEEARQHFEEVSTVAGENLEAARLAAYRIAQLDLLTGDSAAALDRLELLVRPDVRSYDALLVCAHLAWAHAALGHVDRADTLVEQTLKQVRAIESRLCQLEVLSASGATWIELGRLDAAEQTLLEALTLARETRFVWHEAVTQLLLARLRFRQADAEAAYVHFHHGRDLLYHLGGEHAAGVAGLFAGTTSVVGMQ